MDEPKLFSASQYQEGVLFNRLMGLIKGVELYAHWKDGTQYVGTTGRTLKEAVTSLVNVFGASDSTLKELRCKGWNFIKNENGFQLAPSSPSHVVHEDTSTPQVVVSEQVKSTQPSPLAQPSTSPFQNYLRGAKVPSFKEL